MIISECRVCGYDEYLVCGDGTTVCGRCGRPTPIWKLDRTGE